MRSRTINVSGAEEGQGQKENTQLMRGILLCRRINKPHQCSSTLPAACSASFLRAAPLYGSFICTTAPLHKLFLIPASDPTFMSLKYWKLLFLLLKVSVFACCKAWFFSSKHLMFPDCQFFCKVCLGSGLYFHPASALHWTPVQKGSCSCFFASRPGLTSKPVPSTVLQLCCSCVALDLVPSSKILTWPMRRTKLSWTEQMVCKGYLLRKGRLC